MPENGLKILVVDDVRANVLMLRTILSKEGFVVSTACSGPEARAMAASQKVNLVLLDICMPDEDGLQTCQRLKQDPATEAIPVIFISDLQDVKNKVKGFEVGAVDYITKPFEKAEVLARVRLHLRLSEARRTMIAEHSARLRELSQAQQAILARPADLPEARFAVFYHPADAAGGDFYDVSRLGEGIFGYLVADVSGHNLGTSLATPAIKVVVNRFSGPLYMPAETVRTLNDVIRPVLPEGHYLTLIYAHLNRWRGRLTVINAGHPSAIFIPAGGAPQLLETESDVIGIFDSIQLDPMELAVSAGDRLFLYTDGILDALDGRGRKNKIESLARRCHECGSLDLSAAIEALTISLGLNAPGLKDDILLLGVEI